MLITDQIMPKMTGTELAQKILATRADMPIIIYTGFRDQLSEQQAMACGVQNYLNKPISREKLARAIRDVLDDGREPF